MGDEVWGWVSVLAIAAVAVIGLPYLLLGGRRRRGRGRRGDYRVRVGPSTPFLLAVALLRRLDTVLLTLVTSAVLILIVLNARA